jgi:predicted nucleotidyltransferase
MTRKLLDISGKIDRLTIEVLSLISKTASSLGIQFFVIGATARDIILNNAYNISTIRATMDIDFGVQVSNWESYEKMKDTLLATGLLTKTKEPHRLLYAESIRIDILPFGPIAEPDQCLSWPPDHEPKMSTIGFEEAYRYSQTVRLTKNPTLDIQVAAPCGLALMKLFSWSDSYPNRGRDAQDLALLLKTYIQAGNEQRLYEDAGDLLEKEDFDYILAGARLLGRDMAAIMSSKTKEVVVGILNRETGNQNRYRLVESMLKGGATSKDNFEEHLQLLEEMKTGILEQS